MTKNETTILKGVAILLMLFLHLFNHIDGMCHYFVLLGEEPLCLFMSRATNPVAFYVLLGGYGLYYVHKKGDKRRITRIINLFITFWLITTIAVIIFNSLGRNFFDNNFILAINVYLGFSPHINHPAWFLLPYALISLSSKHLFDLFDKYKPWLVIIAMLAFKLITSYIVSRGQNVLPHHEYIYTIVLYFHLLPTFIIGATIHRFDIVTYIRERTNPKFALLLLLCLFIVRCTFTTSIFDTIYAIIFISLFLCIRRWKFVDLSLEMLGKHSTNIWLIHAYIYGPLLHDYIYGLKFTPLVFLGLILTSLIASIAINFIQRPLLISR